MGFRILGSPTFVITGQISVVVTTVSVTTYFQNEAPVIAFGINPIFTLGTAFNYSLASFVSDEESVTYSPTGGTLPSSVTLDTVLGNLVYDGTGAVGTTNNIQFTVDDGALTAESYPFSIVIEDVLTFTVPTIEFQKDAGDATYDLSTHWNGAIPAGEVFDSVTTISGSLPQGVILDSPNERFVFTDANAASTTVVSNIKLQVTTVATSAESDWQTRINDSNVVWHHDFRNEAEMNAFQWTSGYGSGNDPQQNGGAATLLSVNTSDGVTGGGCLQYLYPANTSPNSSYWWRPFSPFDTGNGKITSDPAANSTISVQPWAPTDGGNQISTYNRGWYAHSSYQDIRHDGDEFYLQVRVKMDPRRITGGNASTAVGKFVWLTTCAFSLSDGEHVIWSYGNGGNDGTNNYVRVYVKDVSGIGSFDPLDQEQTPYDGIQPGSDAVTDWSYSGGWDTIMLNVRPGIRGVTSGNDSTRLRIYAAKEGEVSYTKIWDQEYGISNLESGNGLQSLILGGYNNGNVFPQDFYHRFDQIIFSKAFIPCPQV